MEEPDFSGWATKNDLKCKDGRVILRDAFKHQDQMRVPLVWHHRHEDPTNVLGHAILENRAFGVYTRGYFNDSEKGQHAKAAVKHGDIDKLSIYANGLTQHGPNVVHGNILEVSLVMRGANPGAVIDNLFIRHEDGDYETIEGEAIIHTGLTISHAENEQEGNSVEDDTDTDENSSTKSPEEIYEDMTEDEKDVVHYLVAKALEEDIDSSDDESDDDSGDDDSDLAHSDSDDANNSEDSDDSDDSDNSDDSDSSDESLAHSDLDQKGTKMTRNVFDTTGDDVSTKRVLSHDDLVTIVKEGKRRGSMKEAFIAHAEENDYGITDIEFLFPDARATSDKPEILSRRVEWVEKVLNGVKHTPFAKVKSIVADLTAAEARAKGYVKGNEKTEEVIALLKRTTSPTTIYKKQKLDRDDLIDITEIDVIAWLKWEIRYMLNEELARAILIGDGRASNHDDKIKDPGTDVDGVGIRSIMNDHSMYSVKKTLEGNISKVDMIDEISKGRSDYRGSGSPSLFIDPTILTDLLHVKDKIGRRLYDTVDALASALRVKEIIEVEVFGEVTDLVAIMVNLADYNVGTSKGGEINFFTDFDIDFNQEKYLMETRSSGALTKPQSAIVFKRELGTPATPQAPSFNGGTNTITIPTVTGINYLINDIIVTGNQVITEDTTVVAVAKPDYYIPAGKTTEFNYTYVDND